MKLLSAKRLERDQRFVASLQVLVRGVYGEALRDLATILRRSPAVPWRAFRWLAPWTQRASSDERRRLFLVAGLFALHPVQSDGGNLGAALAKAASMRPGGASASYERRFMALLDADDEDLEHHLRRAVTLVRDAAIGLDWVRLLTDLRQWNDPLQRVQSEWARSFWAQLPCRDPSDD